MDQNNGTANFDMPRMLLDNVLIMTAYGLSCFIYNVIMRADIFSGYFWLLLIFSVIFTLTMSMMRMYNITTFYYTDRIISRIFIATVVSGMSLSTAIFLYKAVECSRLWFVLFCVIADVTVTLGRLINRILRSAEIGNGYTHIIFIGGDEVFERYKSYIEKTSMKIKVDKHIDITDPVLKSPEALCSLLTQHSVNEVVLVSDSCDARNERIQGILGVCSELGWTVRVIEDICVLPNYNHFVSSLGPFPVITYHNVSFNKVQLFFKAALDVVCAAVGLIVASPLMLVTAIFIKLESPGPVLFKQKRVGRNGKVFEIYKFRSMYVDAEKRKEELLSQNKIKDGMMFKIENDPRVTRVGAFIRKSSIDELPQLINVLKRNMSLVGTRPPTLDEVEKYAPSHWRRVSIMPGITGMWQVSGRSTIVDFEEVVSLDKKYIDNWSIGLDIVILLRTIGVLVTKRGAS